MIIKRPDGFVVVSHEGKVLGGPYNSRTQAEKRMAQIESFKKMDMKMPMKGK